MSDLVWLIRKLSRNMVSMEVYKLFAKIINRWFFLRKMGVVFGISAHFSKRGGTPTLEKSYA